jgi:hypothetical protein
MSEVTGYLFLCTAVFETISINNIGCTGKNVNFNEKQAFYVIIKPGSNEKNSLVTFEYFFK